MSTELIAPAIQTTAITPMELIAEASRKGTSIEAMTQLFELQIRWEENEARKAFNEAMAKFKANPPQIERNKHVTHNDFWHATIDEVVGKIAPALSLVGIRHRWETSQVGPTITVTCILSHSLGHSESTPLSGAPDITGSKNAVQAIGSTVTYLQRYTLLAATGMAAANTDDDGGNAKLATDYVVGDIEAAKDLPTLQNLFQTCYLLAAKRPEDQKKFKAAYEIRKAQLSKVVAK